MSCLHPCTLPQQAPFADVRRVSPLCAAFCPACECVRDATGKANVAPTCAKNTKSQSSNAIAILRGGAAKWMSFRARAEAKDMELVPTKEPASHLASRRCPDSPPNASNRAEARAHFYERRKDQKRQTIQHPNSSTRSGNDTLESSTSPYEPERLCDRVLSRKTHRDS